MIISSLAFEAYQALFRDLREGTSVRALCKWLGCSRRGARVALTELVQAGLASRLRHTYRLAA